MTEIVNYNWQHVLKVLGYRGRLWDSEQIDKKTWRIRFHDGKGIISIKLTKQQIEDTFKMVDSH